MEYTFRPIFRSLLSSKQFQNEKCLKVWIWCLLKSTDKSFIAYIGRQEVPLERGQFVFGTLRAIEELKMSSSTIWFWLRWLEKDGSLAIKSTNKFSIISISKQSKFDEILNGLLGNRKETEKKQKRTYNKDKKEKEWGTTTIKIAELLGVEPTEGLDYYLVDKYKNYIFKDFTIRYVEWCREKKKEPTISQWMNWVRRDEEKGQLTKKER